MNVLYIDTHDKDVNLIIYENNKIKNQLMINNYKQLSEIMINSIDQLLKKCNYDLKDLNQICVVSGPGSFTSTRIGVTIAKTLAYSLNIEIKSITYLEILGWQILDNPNKIIEMPEKNGHFIAKYHDNVIENMFYLSNNEYILYKQKNEVLEDIKIDYNSLINHINDLPCNKVFDVNPIYIKSIGALND